MFSVYMYAQNQFLFVTAYIHTSQNLFPHPVLWLPHWTDDGWENVHMDMSVMNLLLFIWSTLHWWVTGFELDLICSKMIFKTEKRLKCSCFLLLSFYNEECVKSTCSIKVIHWSIIANMIWRHRGAFLIIFCPPYICLCVSLSLNFSYFNLTLHKAFLSEGGFKFIELKDHPIFQGEIFLNDWKFPGIVMPAPWNGLSI